MYSNRVAKVDTVEFSSGNVSRVRVSKKSGFSPGFPGFRYKSNQNSGRVGVRVPFFGVGSGLGITKSGFYPSGFRVPDFITTTRTIARDTFAKYAVNHFQKQVMRRNTSKLFMKEEETTNVKFVESSFHKIYQ